MAKIRDDNFIPTIKGISKGVISAIPYIGSTAVAIYDEIQSKQAKRKIKRLEDLYNNLYNDMNKIKDAINQDCIKKEDFIDIFEKTTNYVINERSERKRQMLKNVFEHTITDEHFDFDETEKFLRILSQLDQLEIELLAILYNPSEYNERHGFIIKDPINNQWQMSRNEYSAGEILTVLLNKKDSEVRSAMAYLYFNGMVENNIEDKKIYTNSNPIHVLDNTLSILGRRFVSYFLN